MLDLELSLKPYEKVKVIDPTLIKKMMMMLTSLFWMTRNTESIYVYH